MMQRPTAYKYIPLSRFDHHLFGNTQDLKTTSPVQSNLPQLSIFSFVMMQAFILSMQVSSGRSPNSTTSNSKPRQYQQKKRARVSDLARKYRSVQADLEEDLLIGDHTSDNVTDISTMASISEHFITSTNSISTSDINYSQVKPNVVSRFKTNVASKYQRHQQSPVNTVISRSKPIRYSRFPSEWDEATQQIGNAVEDATNEGYDHIRVDVKSPELISHNPLQSVIPNHLVDSNLDSSIHQYRIPLLVEAANDIIRKIFRYGPGNPRKSNIPFTPKRAAIYFNSTYDFEIGRESVDIPLDYIVDTHTLGTNVKKPVANVIVMIAPCNRQGNPEHIEAVEIVHYSNWQEPNIVVMINPDLIALTNFTAVGDEHRQPSFLKDYNASYYLDPAAFLSRAATGAVLRCFPRKWEMYLQKDQNRMGFRLIAEQENRPSNEKISCEFSWRIEKELQEQKALG